MPNLCRCVRCNDPLEPAQHLRFLVETDTLDDPAYLARIRALPARNGRPLPVCGRCQAEIAASPPPPPAQPRVPKSLVYMFGALSIGVLLGAVFNSRG